MSEDSQGIVQRALDAAIERHKQYIKNNSITLDHGVIICASDKYAMGAHDVFGDYILDNGFKKECQMKEHYWAILELEGLKKGLVKEISNVLAYDEDYEIRVGNVREWLIGNGTV